MTEYFYKTCKTHGGLQIKDIKIRVRDAHIELICLICKRENDKASYSNNPRYLLRKKSKNLICSSCKIQLSIDKFTDSGLKSKYAKCRNCTNEFQKNHYRNNYLLKRYGITNQDYDNLVIKQKNLCAICEKPDKRKNGYNKIIGKLCVDHCHKTGKVRGLLCHLCNSGIGKLQDSPFLLRKAADYLDSHA